MLRRNRPVFLSLTIATFALLLLWPTLPAFGLDDPELTLAVKRAGDAVAWVPALQSRVEFLRNLLFAAIALTFLTAICGLFTAKWLKISCGILGALAVALGSIRQYYEAPQDGAGAIASDILDYQNNVYSHRTNYSIDSEHLQNVPKALPKGAEEEWGKNIAQWKKSVTDEAQQLRSLNEVGGKLIVRAEKLLNATEPPTLSGLSGVSGIVYAQSPAAQSGKYRPPWLTSPTPDPDYLQAVGEATCYPASAAREYARYEARRGLAQQLEPTAKDERLDAILRAIDSSVDESRNFAEPGPSLHQSGGAQRSAPVTVHQYWLVRLYRGTAQEKLKEIGSPAPRPKASWVAEGDLVKSVTTIGGLKKGDSATFNFTFAPGKDDVELTTLEVINDGSVGSTRWAFDILVEGKRVLSIPTHRLDDGGRPSVCLPQRSEGLQFAVPKLPAKIRIEGFRGADLY